MSPIVPDANAGKPRPGDCVVYLGMGQKAWTYCVKSITSLRRHEPQRTICIITNLNQNAPIPNCHIVRIKEPDHLNRMVKSSLDRYIPAEFKRIVFLDADTEIFGSLSPVFALLATRHIVACRHLSLPTVRHRKTRMQRRVLPQIVEDVEQIIGPNGPWFDTILFAWNRHSRTKAFFELWAELWRHYAQRIHVFDHPSFNLALQRSGIPFAETPPRFVVWRKAVAGQGVVRHLSAGIGPGYIGEPKKPAAITVRRIQRKTQAPSVKASPATTMTLSSIHQALGAEDATLLEKTCREIAPKSVLEIGARFGHSTIILASVCKETGGIVQTIEPFPKPEWKSNLESRGLSPYARMIVGESPWVNPELILQPIDYLFIDGDHRTRWCMMDYHYWQKFVHIGGRIAFHDFNTMRGVQSAVQAILPESNLKEIAKTKSDSRLGLIVFEKIAEEKQSREMSAWLSQNRLPDITRSQKQQRRIPRRQPRQRKRVSLATPRLEGDKLLLPPWFGEFGWEIATHVPYCREMCRQVGVRGVATSFLGMGPLYDDFADFVPHEKLERECIFDRYRLGQNALYRKYGMPDNRYDILVHTRGIDHDLMRNYRHWNELFSALKSFGKQIAVIGTFRDQWNQAWAVSDERDIPLDQLMNLMAGAKVTMGVISGPIHLATHCACPVLVWGYNNRHFGETLEQRCKITWNPHGSRVDVLCGRYEEYQPPPKMILDAIERILA